MEGKIPPGMAWLLDANVPPPGTLHARIARALGWSESDVRSFGFHALRELVRPIDTALAAEIDEAIRAGSCIRG